MIATSIALIYVIIERYCKKQGEDSDYVRISLYLLFVTFLQLIFLVWYMMTISGI